MLLFGYIIIGIIVSFIAAFAMAKWNKTDFTDINSSDLQAASVLGLAAGVIWPGSIALALAVGIWYLYKMLINQIAKNI